MMIVEEGDRAEHFAISLDSQGSQSAVELVYHKLLLQIILMQLYDIQVELLYVVGKKVSKIFVS